MAAVKAPCSSSKRQAMLQDLTAITGAEMTSEETSGKLENLTVEQFGTAKKGSISKDESVILDGLGEKALIEERWRRV